MKNQSSKFDNARMSKELSSFRGPLNSYQIILSIDRNKGLLRRLTVFSQGKRSILIKYLWGKLLWDELNSEEARIFWSLPDVTKNKTIYLGLKALVLGVNKRDLRNRLEKASILFNLFHITRQQYLSIKGRVNFFFHEETVSLRRSTKFSGYTKHYKDKGSLGSEREFYLSEITDLDVFEENDIILNFLTVGEITILGSSIFHPDEAK